MYLFIYLVDFMKIQKVYFQTFTENTLYPQVICLKYTYVF